MEKVSRKSVNKCKEDLEIPFGSGSTVAKEKKKSDKTDKKKTKNEDDPMADEKSDDSASEKSGSGSEGEEED